MTRLRPDQQGFCALLGDFFWTVTDKTVDTALNVLRRWVK